MNRNPELAVYLMALIDQAQTQTMAIRKALDMPGTSDRAFEELREARRLAVALEVALSNARSWSV